MARTTITFTLDTDEPLTLEQLTTLRYLVDDFDIRLRDSKDSLLPSSMPPDLEISWEMVLDPIVLGYTRVDPDDALILARTESSGAGPTHYGEFIEAEPAPDLEAAAQVWHDTRPLNNQVALYHHRNWAIALYHDRLECIVTAATAAIDTYLTEQGITL